MFAYSHGEKHNGLIPANQAAEMRRQKLQKLTFTGHNMRRWRLGNSAIIGNMRRPDNHWKIQGKKKRKV